MDTYPNSLSTSTTGGVATRLIQRNTKIPTRESEIFSTNKDYQTCVNVEVYEGERPMAADNVLVGSVTLTGIPPAPRGVPKIEVTFEINNNGILNVSARDMATERSTSAVMTAPSRLSPERMEVVTGIVAEEMEKVRYQFAQSEAQKRVQEIETLLTNHRSDLTAQQVSIFQGGCRVVTDYLERKACLNDLQHLLAGLKQEFDNALSDLDHGRSANITRSILSIFEDVELNAWAESAAADLNDDSILGQMRDFETLYESFIKTIVHDLNAAANVENVCSEVLASLRESTGAKHCFGLVLSHFAPRVPLALEKIAEPSSVEPGARALLDLLLFRELGRAKSGERRTAAARCLSNMYQPQYLGPVINRLQGEVEEVLAPLNQCLYNISSETWYAYYNSTEPERRQDRFSLLNVRTRLRNALIEMLHVKGVEEQKAILAALGELTDSIPTFALLNILNRAGDEDLQCQIISLLSRSRDSSAVLSLLDLMLAKNQKVREAARKALDDYGDSASEGWAEHVSTQEWYPYYFAASPIIQARWLSSALIRPKLRKALCEALPEKTVDEQRTILENLAQMPPDRSAPDYLKLLPAILTQEELCCRLISMLPALKDGQVVNPLIKLLVDERQQVREAASAALEECKDLIEPETERFIKLTKAAMETGRAPSLTNRFFLSGYLKRHKELEEVANRLKQQQRH
jgi:HEAT repeat protein